MSKISYQEYLNQINTYLNQMNETQLRQLLFSIAKKQAEDDRCQFLENFKLKKHKPFDEKEYQKYLRCIKKLSLDDCMITRRRRSIMMIGEILSRNIFTPIRKM